MTDPHHPVPDRPHLETADIHRAAAEHAAAQGDYDTALRERFRAMLRGLEQHEIIEVRRSRTAGEISHETAAALRPELSGEIPPAAAVFDEVVYGGRPAAADEYQRLVRADRFSAAAPPPAAEPKDAEAARRRSRPRLALPPFVRDPRLWAGLAAAAVVVLVVYGVVQGLHGPSAPRPPDTPPIDLPDYPPDDDRSGRPRPTGDDSIFADSPDRLVFGILQFMIAGIVLVWWRARRRGAVVAEPRPVEVAAGELLDGQAGLYRRSGDHAHIAGVLQAATVRRVRRALGVDAGISPDALVTAVAARIGADRDTIGAALFGHVSDAAGLELVAAQLQWIEAEVG